jgi:mono/diheme cytochrome c family protein
MNPYRTTAMLRRSLLGGGALSLALLAACQAGSETPASAPQPSPAPAPAARPAPAAPAAPAAPSGMRTVRSGVYTVAQAGRGEEVFNTVCSNCHSPSEWTDGAFLRRWTGQPLMRLFTYIHLNMPNDNPRSLSEQQVADVITYIFRLNGMPTGSTELDTDPYTLDEIQIDWIEP